MLLKNFFYIISLFKFSFLCKKRGETVADKTKEGSKQGKIILLKRIKKWKLLRINIVSKMINYKFFRIKVNQFIKIYNKLMTICNI